MAVSMIAEKMRLAKQSEEGGAQELDRYMSIYFDYSTENDIPTMLSLATRWVWLLCVCVCVLKFQRVKIKGSPSFFDLCRSLSQFLKYRDSLK